MNTQQQQKLDNCINGLVSLLMSHNVEIPAKMVNGDKLTDLEILDKLLELVEDYNLEYEIVGNGAILKPIVKQSHICRTQLKGSNSYV